MQLDERVLTHIAPERKPATATTAFTRATWVTVTVTNPQRDSTTGFAVARRATAAAATTTETGIRREHAGGIIIGVSLGGLLLLIFLAWCCRCCSSGRRQSRFSDTSSSSPSTSRPSYSKPGRYVPPGPPPGPRPPPEITKPELAHTDTIPRRTGLTNKDYDKAKYKTVIEKDGKKVVVGGPKKTPKAVAWTRPRKPKDFNIPPEDINTFDS
jgi:hypothetical protein